ncbi:hypothetical protein PR048_012362 [Dryococelus australis]|uniref:Uncharacterized protein n=1 Tax=Dryococelus australis TaxID=614101 RepID=A0ABQ9HP58_9NEOP|nr:hypothetical protein PR048_012362 [Dryococelus australis]
MKNLSVLQQKCSLLQTYQCKNRIIYACENGCKHTLKFSSSVQSCNFEAELCSSVTKWKEQCSFVVLFKTLCYSSEQALVGSVKIINSAAAT